MPKYDESLNSKLAALFFVAVFAAGIGSPLLIVGASMISLLIWTDHLEAGLEAQAKCHT